MIGYKRCEYDCCVYVKSLDDSSSFIFLLLYVDDMLIAAKSMIEVNKLKSLLSKEFDMKDLGVAKKILGMEFTGIELQGDYGYLSITMLRDLWQIILGCLLINVQRQMMK